MFLLKQSEALLWLLLRLKVSKFQQNTHNYWTFHWRDIVQLATSTLDDQITCQSSRSFEIP